MATRKIIEGINSLSELSDSDKKWVGKKLRKKLATSEFDTASFFTTWLEKKVPSPTVFISHNHADKPFVRNLYNFLSEHQINVWLDETELSAGDSLAHCISEAVRDIDYLVVVLSPASVKSPWVQKELDWAFQAELNNKVKIIPIIKKHCKIPPLLMGKLHLDFTTRSLRKKSREELLKSILNHAK